MSGFLFISGPSPCPAIRFARCAAVFLLHLRLQSKARLDAWPWEFDSTLQTHALAMSLGLGLLHAPSAGLMSHVRRIV